MNTQNTTSGQASAERTADTTNELKWPVLARLPWVGDRRAGQGESPNFAAIEAMNERAIEPQALRLAEQSFESSECERSAAPCRAPMHGALERRTFIDQPHLTVRGYDWPEAIESPVAAAPTTREAAAERQRLRLDSGCPRPAPAPAAIRSNSPDSKKHSIAAKFAQLHAAAAPHAGVVMTLALVFAVGLLCFITLGERNGGSDYHQGFDGVGGWPEQTTTQSPASGSDAKAPAQSALADFAWKAAPVINAPSPGVTEGAGTPESRVDVSASIAALERPAEAPPAPQPASTAIAIAPRAASEPITPTPMPMTGPYPTTPYGEFNYFANAQAPAARQAPVANRSAIEPAGPQGPR